MEIPVTIQRGASNTYFAETINSILIPPYSRLLQQVLDRPDVWPIIEALPLVDGKLHRDPLVALAKTHGIDPEIFIRAVDEKYAAGEEAGAEAVSEQEYRAAEYRAFLGPRPPRSERRDFDLLPGEIEQYSDDFRRCFEKVVMIPKLRETPAEVMHEERLLVRFGPILSDGSGQTSALVTGHGLAPMPPRETAWRSL